MVKNTLFLLLLFLSCSNCDNNSIDNVVRESIGKKIYIPDIDFGEYTIIRYVDNPSCTSCQLKLPEWSVWLRKLKNKYGSLIDIEIAIIIETQSKDIADRLMKIYKFDNNRIDHNIGFYKMIDIDSLLGKDVVFLVNSKKEILLIGNPLENQDIADLYNYIFDGNL